ncbi:MAG TPA: HupE/UreJ family protein [Verrucomicrobiae bacterium]|nr:HupE/UreJ family protein [Verrucomicrobiae bacterium]
MRALAALLLALAALPATAHPLAPGLLELTEVAPERYAVLWRTSVARAASGPVTPRLPETCTALSTPDERIEAGEALTRRWVVRCEGDLAGAALAVDGLDGSGINVIVRVVPLAGAPFSALLGADEPETIVALEPVGVFGPYLAMGMEHLVLGLDHLLFLLGLFLLVPGVRSLVATVTAFTLGHSVTLSLAVLGVVPMMSPLAELLIAASLLWVALALITRASRPGALPQKDLVTAPSQKPLPNLSVGGPLGPTSRWHHPSPPWLTAAAFGLIHGLGFAAALREAGLPADAVPLSLLAFNLGIEAAQLAVIALLLVAALAARRWSWPRPGPALAAHGIGAMAVCWMLERSFALIA